MLGSLAALRTVTNVIQSLPPQELPQRAQFFTSAIAASSAILSSAESHIATKDGTDAAVLVHKYKTQISALLNGKSREGRWIAVVLIKSTLHAGGWEILRGCESWVRGLLVSFNKSSPSSTKILEILTLSRIYALVQEYPTLVREIATPTLPAFINGCFNLVSTKSGGSSQTRELKDSTSALQAVLEMFNLLLPIYPTIFRPFLVQLQSVVTPLLASPQTLLVGDNNLIRGESVSELARQLSTKLHFCAPKNTHSDDWRRSLEALVEEIHLTIDQVFRGIIEDWEPSDGAPRPLQSQSSYKEPMSIQDGPMNLPKFQGVFEGVQRLIGLIETLRVFLANETAGPVQLHLGVISDLVSRLTSITGSKGNGNGYESRINPEIDRFERDAMFCELPKIHIAAMRALLTLYQRLGNAFVPLTSNAIDQVLWIFDAEKDSEYTRAIVYRVMAALLEIGGSSVSNASLPLISTLVRSCCSDLLREHLQPGSTSKSTMQNGVSKRISTATNADSYLVQASSLEFSFKPLHPELQDSASTLLPIFLGSLPTSMLTPSIRAQVDRTAVLTKNKKAMVASVLNPQPARKGAKVVSSILPHLARAFGGDQDVEGLLRPRMPVIMTGLQMADFADESDEDRNSIGPGKAGKVEENDLQSPQSPPSPSYQPMEITYHNTQSLAHTNRPIATIDVAGDRTNTKVIASSETVATAVPAEKSLQALASKRSLSLDMKESPISHEHANKRPKAAEDSEEDGRESRHPEMTATSSSSSLVKSQSSKHERVTSIEARNSRQEDAAADEDEDEDDFEIPTVVLDADTSDDDESDDGDDDRGDADRK